MSLETVRINMEGKERLSRLKKYTGVENWNILCRWAFCKSLADETIPPQIDYKGETGVEMTWKVFGGAQQEIYMALLRERCVKDGLGDDYKMLSEQFWLHLHRGLGHLASDRTIRIPYDAGRKSVRGLLELTQS